VVQEISSVISMAKSVKMANKRRLFIGFSLDGLRLIRPLYHTPREITILSAKMVTVK
jgi:hypothetical protein